MGSKPVLLLLLRLLEPGAPGEEGEELAGEVLPGQAAKICGGQQIQPLRHPARRDRVGEGVR